MNNAGSIHSPVPNKTPDNLIRCFISIHLPKSAIPDRFTLKISKVFQVKCKLLGINLPGI